MSHRCQTHVHKLHRQNMTLRELANCQGVAKTSAFGWDQIRTRFHNESELHTRNCSNCNLFWITFNLSDCQNKHAETFYWSVKSKNSKLIFCVCVYRKRGNLKYSDIQYLSWSTKIIFFSHCACVKWQTEGAVATYWTLRELASSQPQCPVYIHHRHPRHSSGAHLLLAPCSPQPAIVGDSIIRNVLFFNASTHCFPGATFSRA